MSGKAIYRAIHWHNPTIKSTYPFCVNCRQTFDWIYNHFFSLILT